MQETDVAPANRPRAWLKGLISPWSRRVVLAAFIASFFMPVLGLGPDLCPLHATTGLPCPGCGVSRGLSMLSQGEFLLALGANPFVVFLWPFFLVLGVTAFLPQARVDEMERRLDRLEPWFSRVFRVLFAAFFGFGFLRLGYFAISRDWFP